MSVHSPTAVAALAAGDAGAVLARHGRSFHFAGRWLDAAQAHDSARLYAFCRRLDDIADHANDAQAGRRRLRGVLADLHSGHSDEAWIADFLLLTTQHRISRRPAVELVRGLLGDLDAVRLADDRELIRYCYRVAGTVGLMMCGVLDVRDPAARPFAVDLGIAMQLTNIARDVAEDAAAGRRYLPAAWVGRLEPAQILAPSAATAARLRHGVARLLDCAETYYDSGRQGLRYLPPRPRRAIRVASAVYRGIGRRLRARGCDSTGGRVVVPGWQKLLLAVGATIPTRAEREGGCHDPELHQPLSGLTGPHPPAAGCTDASPSS